MAGRCNRAELLGGPQGNARDNRADDEVFAKADERDAECRLPFGSGRAQYLSLLSRVYGAVCSPVSMGRSENRRRMLRYHGGAYQTDPFGSAVLTAATGQNYGRR